MPGDVTRVLFVCLGNICRSPTAEGVFAALAARHQIRGQLQVDSCGTSDWHLGRPPDPRTVAIAARRGYDLSGLCARQVQVADFQRFDYILAMDRANLADLQALCPQDFRGHLGLLLPFSGRQDLADVPDPYHGGEAHFEQVLDIIESAAFQTLGKLFPHRVQ